MKELTDWFKIRRLPLGLIFIHTLVTLPFSKESLSSGDLLAWLIVLGPLIATFLVGVYLYWTANSVVNVIALRWLLYSGPVALTIALGHVEAYPILRLYIIAGAFIFVSTVFSPNRIEERFKGESSTSRMG